MVNDLLPAPTDAAEFLKGSLPGSVGIGVAGDRRRRNGLSLGDDRLPLQPVVNIQQAAHDQREDADGDS